MTDRYMRNASAVRGGQFGEPFPALPAIRHSIVIDDSGLTELAKNKHFRRGGRDSNALSASFATVRRRSVFRLIVRVPSPFCPLAVSTAVR